MSVGRPAYRFLLLDLPADHEVDGFLATESEVIRSILANNDSGPQVLLKRISTLGRFRGWSPPKGYKKLRFVHLGTHACREHIHLIGGKVTWEEVAEKLRRLAPCLPQGEQRALCLSSCFSRDGFQRIRKKLRGHFSGCYYFSSEEIAFADAITVWSMFYLRARQEKPHDTKLLKAINQYFGKEALCFKKLSTR